MLYVISNAEDSLVKLFADDPVRPGISVGFRCHSPDNCVFVLLDGFDNPEAVLCCSFKSYVPSSLDQLMQFESISSRNAIFYSVWSYSKGSGRRIIPLAQAWIRSNRSEIVGFYTYSPPGERVRDFHYSLGARLYRENVDSINYVYG
jgi:hypothetical protein